MRHRFTLVVTGRNGVNITREQAERDVLRAFSLRAPDSCEFSLLRTPPLLAFQRRESKQLQGFAPRGTK